MWLTLLPYSGYCGGLEANLQELWGVHVLFLRNLMAKCLSYFRIMARGLRKKSLGQENNNLQKFWTTTLIINIVTRIIVIYKWFALVCTLYFWRTCRKICIWTSIRWMIGDACLHPDLLQAETKIYLCMWGQPETRPLMGVEGRSSVWETGHSTLRIAPC